MKTLSLIGFAALGCLVTGCGAKEPEGDPNAAPSAMDHAAPNPVMSAPAPEKGDEPGGAGTGMPIGGVDKKKTD